MDVATAPEPTRRTDRLEWPRPTWTWLLILGLLSRIAVLAWGDCCARTGMHASQSKYDELVAAPNRNFQARHLAALAVSGRRLVQPWYRWDALWYAEVSQAGYDYDPQRPSSTAFLPLLPVLMAAGTRVGLDRYWVGLMAVNLAFAVGLACFGRAVLRTTGDCGTTWRSCLLLTAYPYALYFSAPYQESLGFALMAAAILAWSVQRPIAASISLSLSSLARLTTAAMCLGLVAEWLDDKVHRRPSRNSAWLVALSGGLGFGLFCAYLAVRFGDPLVHFRAHASWGRQPASVRNVALVLGTIFQQGCSSPMYFLVSLTILVCTCHGAVRSTLAWLWACVLSQLHDPGSDARRSGFRFQVRTARPEKGQPDPPSPSEPATTVQEHPAETIALGHHASNVIAFAIILAVLSLAIPGSTTRYVAVDPPPWLDCLAVITFLGLGVHAWWRRGPLWGCMVLVPILQGLATGTALSINRVVLAAFPAFIDLAELLGPRLPFWTCMVVSIFAQAMLIDHFVNWAFLG